MRSNSRKTNTRRSRKLGGVEGVDFVRCRICGDRRRVISSRHLSKHGTDREEYMREYRLSPDELIAKGFRVIQSSRRGYQPHGRREWIAAIKKLHGQHRSVFARDLQDKHAYLDNQGVWIFGDWDKALRAAGFNPERMRMHTFWDNEKITQELRRMRKENLPLYPYYVMKNHPDLFSGARRQFGSWRKALIAAGLTSKKQIPRKNCFGLLRDLRDVVESRSAISPALRREIEYYFGSLRNAKFLLKTDTKLSSGWSKRKIVAVLAQKHRSKEKLNYGTIRRDSPALLSAAEAYFGSWGKALYAAGIDPNLYFPHHTWRKTRMKVVRI